MKTAERIVRQRAVWILGGATLLLFYGSLLLPSRTLIARDLPFLHLPLRAAFVRLVADGLPLWNSALHGGQPVLSNPHYAAFYPPTWLHLLVPLPYSLNLLIVLHAAVGFAGTWRLVRALGGPRDSAALGAIGFTAGGALLSLPSVFNLYCGTAWLPWIAVAGLRLSESTSGRGVSSRRLTAAAVVALPLLAGSPAVALIGGLVILIAALVRLRPVDAARSVISVAVLAALLSAAQWVPTLQRVAGSSRQGALEIEEAGEWSSSPLRLLELWLPHFAGDPGRDEEQLYFGWELHDKGFPLVLSIYPSLLLSLLAPLALFGSYATRDATGRRRFLAALALLAVFFALGRHNPLYAWLHPLVPILRSIRYPEKFLVLFGLSWAVAGGLGWDALFRQGKKRLRWAPVGLFGGLVAAAATYFLFRPEALTALLTQFGGELPPGAADAGLGYVRGHLLVQLAAAVAVGGLVFAAGRWPTQRLRLTGLAVVLMFADLWIVGHSLNPIGPSAWLTTPPPLAQANDGGRLLSTVTFDPRPEFGLPLGKPGLQQIRTKLDRLDPYSGLLWNEQYVLHEDYDLLLTPWARHALELLENEWQNPAARNAIVGAWAVRSAVARRPPKELLDEYRKTGQRPQPARRLVVEQSLPRYRTVAAVDFVAETAAAVQRLKENNFDVSATEIVIGRRQSSRPVTEPTEHRTFTATADLTEVTTASVAHHTVLRYQAATPNFVVAAMTYDRGWSASLDGQPLTTYPTALGQLGVELPAGDGHLELHYSDPSVGLGLSVTLLTLAITALVGLRRRRITTAAPERR